MKVFIGVSGYLRGPKPLCSIMAPRERIYLTVNRILQQFFERLVDLLYNATMQSDIVRWSVKIFGADFISHNIYSPTVVLVVLRRDLFTTDLFRTQDLFRTPSATGGAQDHLVPRRILSPFLVLSFRVSELNKQPVNTNTRQ